MAQDILVVYRAEVSQLTRELNAVIEQQTEITKLEKQGNQEAAKNIKTEEFAAQQRLKLLKLEEQELRKLQQLRKLAFDPKTISDYDKKIAASTRNIQLLGGEIKKSLGGVGATIRTIGTQIASSLALGFSAAAIINFSKASVNAFLDAEDNANRLKNAIVNIAGESEDAFDRLIRQSQELQEITIFSDDDIQRAQTALATFGLTSDQIEELLPKLADFATVANTDIVSAAQQVGAALEGNGREFKKYQIEVSATASRTDNLNKILTGFTKFAGSAERATASFSGKLAQQKNRVDDLMEQIGERLLPAFLKIVEFGGRAVKTITDLFGPKVQSQAEKASERFTKIASEFNISIEVLKRGNLAQEQRKTLIDEINTQYGEYLPNLLTEKSTLQEIEKAQAAVNKQLEGRILLVALEEDIVRITKNAAAAARDLIQIQKDRIKAEKDLSDNSQLAANTRTLLNNREALANELIRVARAELGALQKAYADLAAQLGINLNQTTDVVQSLDDTRAATEELIKPLERIEKSYNDLSALQNIWVEGEKGINSFQVAVKKAADELDKLIQIPDKLEVPENRRTTNTPPPVEQSFFEENQFQIDAVIQSNDLLLSIHQSFLEARILQINEERDAELKALDEREQAINDQLEKRRISESQAAQLQKKLLQERTEAEKRATEEERRLKKKAAILERSAALIKIAIATAVNATEQPGPFGALIPYWIGLGALEAGAVLAQPIPYKKGSKDTGKSGHLARVGEEGEEIVYMPGHSKVLPAGPTKTYGEALDAMFDGRFEKYVMKKYTAPLLEKQRKVYEDNRQESFVKNIANSYMLSTGLTNDAYINGVRSIVKSNDPSKFGQAVAQELAKVIQQSDPYRR